MKIEKIKNNNEVKLSEYDLNQLEKIIKFENHGKYYSNGRTCYYKLKKPIHIRNTVYSYLKIKGCGIIEENGIFVRPGTKSFIREDPHFGIKQNGVAELVYSDIAPYGGITLSRALNEYNNFKILCDNEVSSLIPVCVYKYDDLFFDGKQMGVSISLCENNKPLRMDKLLYIDKLIPEEYKKFYEEIYFLEFNENTTLNFKNKCALINRISYKYGMEMRKFCDSGLYIHSGGWSNIQYSIDRKNVVLIDLDSSMEIHNNTMIPLLNCRDLISNIYRLFINLYNPNCISNFDEDVIKCYNFTLSILDGFFNNIELEKIEYVSKQINIYFINNCFNEIKQIEDIMLNITDEQVKKYELNILEFYDFCMKLIFPLIIDEYKVKSNSYKLYKSYERR